MKLIYEDKHMQLFWFVSEGMYMYAKQSSYFCKSVVECTCARFAVFAQLLFK